MFVLKKFEAPSEELSFQETRDLAWSAANANICFNVSKCITLDGLVDADVLSAAVGDVIARHESLRTAFVTTGKYAFRRVIHERLEFALEVLDKRSLPVEHSDVALALRDFTEHRFEIDAFPLFRVLKVDVAGDRSVLALSMAHVISDAASTDIFIGDLGKAYAFRLTGDGNALGAPEYSLSDFVQSHRAWMQTDDYLGRLQALRDRLVPGLEGISPDLGACGVLQQKARKAALVRNTLAPEISAKLEGIAKDHKVTHPVALLAVSALALSRVMTQEKLFFSFMLSNRHYAGIGQIIGHVANAVPVFVDTRQGTVRNFVTAMNREFYLSASGTGIIPLGIVNQAVAGLDPVLSVKSPLNQLMLNIAAPSAAIKSFAGMRAAIYRNPYAGFISNALQMSFGHLDNTLVQHCRLPEDEMEQLAPRALQSLTDAIAYVSQHTDSALSGFEDFKDFEAQC